MIDLNFRFRKTSTDFGRIGTDVILTSMYEKQRMMISRSHAHINRKADGTYEIFDDSMNGVFVNHIKISPERKYMMHIQWGNYN